MGQDSQDCTATAANRSAPLADTPDIRLATPADASSILEIYAPLVTETNLSFELEAPSVEEVARRIESTLPRYPWLVWTEGGEVLGYAYGASFRGRPAYAWTVETSVYVRDRDRGRGLARRLMEALLGLLRLAGYQRAVAGITLPNPASVALHEALGFEPVGTFVSAGHKRGLWSDVGFWDLALGHDNPPPTILGVDEVLSQESGPAALKSARGL